MLLTISARCSATECDAVNRSVLWKAIARQALQSVAAFASQSVSPLLSDSQSIFSTKLASQSFVLLVLPVLLLLLLLLLLMRLFSL